MSSRNDVGRQSKFLGVSLWSSLLERQKRVERIRFEASRQENCGIARIGEGAAINAPDGGIRAKRVGLICKVCVCGVVEKKRRFQFAATKREGPISDVRNVQSFTGLLCIIVLVWHFFPGSRLFLFFCNKILYRVIMVRREIPYRIIWGGESGTLPRSRCFNFSNHLEHVQKVRKMFWKHLSNYVWFPDGSRLSSPCGKTT